MVEEEGKAEGEEVLVVLMEVVVVLVGEVETEVLVVEVGQRC